MTTPDPDRKSAPFEWQALTINKVEKIQLARLHEEQDRIENELREQEALERAARQLEAREREGEALEQAWFDAGSADPRDAEHDTQKETAAFTPLKRLSYSLAAFGRRLLDPPPKPRSSVPPPPLNESPISLSLVLAACAFGGSVYLSLRWVAEVRQASVTQQLSSSVNATTPATEVGSNPNVPVATATPIAAIPNTPIAATPAPTASGSTPTAPIPLQPPPSAPEIAPQASAGPVTAGAMPPSERAFVPASPSRATSTPPRPGAALSAVAQPAVAPAPVQPPNEVPAVAAVPDVAAVPATGTPPMGRSRVLVPAAGSPHSNGTRVYRGGE